MIEKFSFHEKVVNKMIRAPGTIQSGTIIPSPIGLDAFSAKKRSLEPKLELPQIKKGTQNGNFNETGSSGSRKVIKYQPPSLNELTAISKRQTRKERLASSLSQ